MAIQYGLWLFVGLGFVEASTQCGKSAIAAEFTRIVGGHAAVPGSWPWMVMLNEAGGQACGGALIHPYWVATASHCFDEHISKNTSRWQAYVGKFHMLKHDSTQQKVGIRQIILHPSYDIDTIENDIALLLLEHPVTYNSHVTPICLTEHGHSTRKGDVCVAAGWGETQNTADDSVLNQVRLPILDDDLCHRYDWYGSDFFKATMMCAGYEHGGHDTCAGDSGGPLMCEENGLYHMTGITSWGIDCARPRHPGVYTDVALYVDWVKDTMRKHGHPYE